MHRIIIKNTNTGQLFRLHVAAELVPATIRFAELVWPKDTLFVTVGKI